MQWGRRESIVWPPRGPIHTYGAILLSVAATGLFVYLHYAFVLTTLQKYYLPYYIRSAAAGTLHPADKYQLLLVTDVHNHSRFAQNSDVIEGATSQAHGTRLPLELSPEARKSGLQYLYRGMIVTYTNKSINGYLQGQIYGGEGLSTMFRLPLLFGLGALVLLLPFSIRKDVKRRKEMKYGRRLRGSKLVTAKEFNEHVRGDGIGIKINETKDLLRIPARVESHHFQVIGDTGVGKTSLILQMLMQIQERGDSAIVYDPALEYTERFFNPQRGDIILNPLDKRCPYWGPAEELRRSSEAQALAESIFQPSPGQKDEYFQQVPADIFAHLLKFGPAPEDLVDWMSNPEEIDQRCKGTPMANHLNQRAGPQRAGVLSSLSRVAKSLSLLPKHGTGNGEWTATDWCENRKGWIFITSLPAEMEALRPLISVWIDWLVLRLLPKPQPGQKRVWIVIDELATLQRLPKLHLALTTARKSLNPIVMGFQGKAQLEVIYGHLADVMLSMPATSIFMRTNEPRSAEWVQNNIGKVEIERLRETRFDGKRSTRNFNQESQEQQLVMASQIQGLPDLHAYLKYLDFVTGFSFPYVDLPVVQEGFVARELENDRLTFDPESINRRRRKNDGPSLPTAVIAQKLEPSTNGHGMATKTQNPAAGSRSLKPPAERQPIDSNASTLDLALDPGLSIKDWD